MRSTARDTTPPGAPGVVSRVAAGAESAAGGHTYGQILKSSVLIGGSSIFNVAVGILRSKTMAVLLGPSGFGLMGLYTSILNFAQSIAGMGVNASGVRQIADAVGSGDERIIARTATVLRRVSVVLGALGALGLVLLSRPVAVLTFGGGERAFPVALLSLAVFFSIVSQGQGALIQGLRRIGDLARIGALGGLLGTLATIALVYLLGERGVVPSLVVAAGISVAFSWWYSRGVGVRSIPLSTGEVAREASQLLKLGVAFMASGMLSMGLAYFMRLVIVRRIGIEGAGLYQAAWTIGGLYVGFILQSMGADFYPRLTGVARDHAACNRLVNEQAQVSLLLAGPGVIATLTLAPAVVHVFYSAAFREAVPVLRWICLGAALQVITWPWGFIIMAKGRQTAFLAIEIAYAAATLAMAWPLVIRFGVDGAGVAFFASYVLHGVLVYPTVRRLTGFRCSGVNTWMAAAYLALIGAVFCGFLWLPPAAAIAFGGVSFVASTAYSLRALVRLVSPDRLPRRLRRVLGWARLVDVTRR